MIKSAKDTLGFTKSLSAYDAVMACLAEVEAEQAWNEYMAAHASNPTQSIRSRFKELLIHGVPSTHGPIDMQRAETLPPSLSSDV